MSDTRAKITRVAIVPHLGKAKVGEVANQMISWLEERKIKVFLSAAEAAQLGRDELGQAEGIFPDADILVSLGGDGTILRSVRLLRGKKIPIIGVNLGTLGFLSTVEVSELFWVMEKVLSGDYVVDERMMLECRIFYASGEQKRLLALNEVVIERGERQRMIQIDVTINGDFFNKYTADGLILATPTGSTAYSFSAGGPVVAPTNEVVVMTPISPHSLFGRSVILHPNDKVKIDIPEAIETSVGIDGIVVAKSALVEGITVKRADEKTLLVRVNGPDFYSTFRKKLRFWDFWTETT
ncbi:MAG: NAD(+)/NADH kinase [Actinobacteria bacterium]|nr:NAD(+)/NADH kinase [Actinomycetota bacterium]